MSLRGLVLIFVALTVMLTLAACSSSGQSSDKGGKEQAGKDASGEQAQKQRPPGKATEGKKESAKKGTPKREPPKMSKEAKSKQIAPKKGNAQSKVSNTLEPPKDKTLKLTIPEMKQIEDDTIPTGKGTNEALFRDHAAVHLRDTGFPWQRTANVYIAGHRIGFPGTDSNLVVEPANLSVLRPMKGKNIVSLQTCTLPDYTNRVIYRAVLKDVKT